MADGGSNKGFQAWWKKNRERYNASRRRRYKKDPQYREAVLRQNAEYREAHPRTRAPREIVREVDDRRVVVVPIGRAAKMINRSPQVIRLWERKGLIPKPIFGRRNRVYTINQVKIMAKLAEVLKKYQHDPETKAIKVEALKMHMEKFWGEV